MIKLSVYITLLIIYSFILSSVEILFKPRGSEATNIAVLRNLTFLVLSTNRSRNKLRLSQKNKRTFSIIKINK